VGTDVTTAFETLRKLRTKVCTKSILDNFYEAVLRRTVHNNDDIQGVGPIVSDSE